MFLKPSFILFAAGLFVASKINPSNAEDAAPSIQVGDVICVTGYVMDYFCIALGTLLDNRSVQTLGPDGPIRHSVHCLVDVRSCYTSPFEILAQTENGFGRAWRFADNEMVIEHAKEIGRSCIGCKGTQRQGYRGTFTGTVTALANGDTPATLAVEEVGSFEGGCSAKNMTESEMPPEMLIETGEGSLNNVFLVHGVLMIIGWGLLLPSGAIIAKFGRHRGDSWFMAHRICQILGLIIALIGFVIALNNSQALGDTNSKTLNYPHAIMGVTVMAMGLAQPLNAFVRPHDKPKGEKKTTTRIVWEVVHKGFGWSAIFLAVVTISFGTTIVAEPSQSRMLQLVYGIGCGGVLLVLLGFLITDKAKSDARMTVEEEALKLQVEHDDA